jgi:hypothetical protein
MQRNNYGGWYMQTKKPTILKNVPDKPIPGSRYLFYLHGLIIEEGGIRPNSEEHGYYEYEAILAALAEEGFVVISEPRLKGTEVKPYAEKVAAEIRGLLTAGVAPADIIVVGASKGGAIACYLSTLLKEKDLFFVMLAGLFEKYLVDPELKLYGKVLSIHDHADKLAITPKAYFERSAGLGSFKEIVLALGKGHGLIYQPYREWMEPLLDWVKAE